MEEKLKSFDDFEIAQLDTSETTIFVRMSGSGPPILLLHGFPQTHLMWRGVAPLLARDFTVVCADLRGYGRSGCPASTPDHAPYSKRAMARDMVAVMQLLGFKRFSVAGHDRGGRVAYRLALDHPARIERLAVLDIVATSTVWDRADARFAVAYWPWCLLSQPEPLPERLISSAPDVVIDDAFSGWGSPRDVFDSEIRAAYVDAIRDRERVHAICEEYRAAATLDREHDIADIESGTRITCPMLALWSASGPLHSWYADAGGPVALWRQWCDAVQGHAVEGGHFFPEETPKATAEALHKFFTSS